MEKVIKYSEKFGKVRVMFQDEEKTVLYLENKTTKIIATSRAKLSDTPFDGPAPVLPLKMSKGDKKRSADKKALAKVPAHVLRFENADGTRDQVAYEKFLQQRNAQKWASKSF